jgi:hypothetical protein
LEDIVSYVEDLMAGDDSTDEDLALIVDYIAEILTDDDTSTDSDDSSTTTSLATVFGRTIKGSELKLV